MLLPGTVLLLRQQRNVVSGDHPRMSEKIPRPGRRAIWPRPITCHSHVGRGIGLIALIVGLDVSFLRDRFALRLATNVGIVAVFGILYVVLSKHR